MVEQSRSESQVMIRGLVLLLLLILKNLFDVEVPDELIDKLIELSVSVYIAYAVGNSPRIKGEY